MRHHRATLFLLALGQLHCHTEPSRTPHTVHVKGDTDETSSYLAPESTGLAQSPINILTGEAVPGHHAVQLHYETSREHVTNLGHTVEVDVDPGSSLVFDGTTYDLKQFHFHTPSEHLLDGMTFPMEMHVVHTSRTDPGRLLVVGVLFREGPENPLLSTLLREVPAQVGATVDVDEVRVNLGQLFSPSEPYYHYEGSLTTPPYTEAVTWLVLKQIHTASPEQVETLNTIEGNNARHIQSVRSRKVDTN